ncbi:polysaccharide biosynthesis protein [Lacrimispora aerotolerans]|uniref:polysaccharide biosynthesis protein n=1 Tax=Lacrimispora aerotolerans TaxID=36832 RepID=UPI00047B951D|nr:nucleoside-diphosphate sugar epimerase/dehydratase [Lacrimispora aerotolerans]
MTHLSDLSARHRNFRKIMYLIFDILIIVASSFLGVWVRFDFNIANIPNEYIMAIIKIIPFYILSTIFIFWLMHLYSILWSMAGFRESIYIFTACFMASLVQVAIVTMLQLSLPRSYFAICFVSVIGFEMLLRFSYRALKSLDLQLKGINDKRRIMIVGAGSAGTALLKEVRNSQYTKGRVICFIDDSEYKVGEILNGVKVYGNRDAIPDLVERFNINDIYIAMPSVSANERKEIIKICKVTRADVKVLPGMYQLVNGEVSVSQLRNVEIEDLLGREQIKTNLDEIMGYIEGKTILVTGGGGSIGSELCRQIVNHNPKKLILFDVYENNIYDLQQELNTKYKDIDIEYLIGSVRNSNRVNSIFEKYKPSIVFHAAAHKHVPLMEDSPNEAIKNNVFGTYKTAQAADRFGVERFVLISTDKAVNPTNIMGASKRMCEMIIQMMAKRSRTRFVAVRFGNVLGSNGSVIPLFKKQIEQGGPVTVTHPDIIRYFMTIPEAVSLVLQAGAYAEGGEIFVLNMGEPVKIVDLAKNLIKLSGYEAGEDIKIEFTGLRPGEKLYEEILMDEEGLRETPNKSIYIGKPLDFDHDHFENQLKELYTIANRDSDSIKEAVTYIVPTYHLNNLDL